MEKDDICEVYSLWIIHDDFQEKEIVRKKITPTKMFDGVASQQWVISFWSHFSSWVV